MRIKPVPALVACSTLSLMLLILGYNTLVEPSLHLKAGADRPLTAAHGHRANLDPDASRFERGDPNTEIHRQEQQQPLFPKLWDESSKSGVPSWDGRSPLCSPNRTVAQSVRGFSSLPAHVRDFLTHRHCRSFPLVLQPPPSKCGSAPALNVTLLFAIKSDARNLDRRDVIRRTWGREESARGRLVRRVFVVGVPSERDPERRQLLNALLQEEARQHGDIVQWDFLDTFFNLTLKQVLFLDWLHERCPGARYVFNGDDDIFVNADNLLEHIAAERRQGRGDDHLYEGYVIANVGPIRNAASKYYVPEQVHARDSYPPYVGGGGILMAGRTAMDIRRAAATLPMLPIDDVFLGQCLEVLGLSPKRHPAFRTAGISIPSSKLRPPASAFHPCYYREVLLVHRVEPFQTLIMWAALRDPRLRCGRPGVQTGPGDSPDG